MVNNKLFKIRVNLPTGLFFEDEINSAEIKTNDGYYVILVNHSPVISSISTSVCYIRDNNNKKTPFIIGQGIFKFENNILDIYTNFFNGLNSTYDDYFERIQTHANNFLNDIDQNASPTTKSNNLSVKMEIDFIRSIGNKFKK